MTILAGYDALINVSFAFYLHARISGIKVKPHGTRYLVKSTWYNADLAGFNLFIPEKGIPSVAICGAELNMSANYLSDLLKIETGKSAKDHIHDYII